MATLKEIIEYSKANPNTDYAKQAYKNIQSGKWDEKAKEEGLDLTFAGRGNYTTGGTPLAVAEDKKSLGDRIKEGLGDLKDTAIGVVDQAKDVVSETKDLYKSDATIGQKIAGTLSEIVGEGVGGILGELATGAGKLALTQEGEDKIEELVRTAASGIGENEIVKKAIETYNGLDPVTKKNLEILGGMAGFITEVVGLKGGSTAAKIAAEKTLETGVKVADTAIDVTEAVARETKDAIGNAGKGTSQWLIDSTNKINPTKRQEFKAMTGKSEGEWLQERGIIGTRDETISELVNNYTKIRENVDEALDKIPGVHRDNRVTVVADEAADIAKATESKEASRMAELAEKAKGIGLEAKEINEVKRFYERNVKLGYMKDPTKTSEQVQRATNRDGAIREFLFEVADKGGFDNLRQLNKEVQASRFLADEIAGKLEGQGSNNMIGITDWIVASSIPASPKGVAMLIGKKLLSTETAKAFFAKALAGFPEKRPLPKADMELIEQRAAEFLRNADANRQKLEENAILADTLMKNGFTMSEGKNAFFTEVPVNITKQEQAYIKAAADNAQREQIVQLLFEAREEGKVLGPGFVMMPAEPKYLELPEEVMVPKEEKWSYQPEEE